MELHVFDEDKFVDIGFGLWLIPKIRACLISNYRWFKFDNWETYINTSDNVKRIYEDKEYKVLDIIIQCANNLVCEGTDGDIRIQINKNTYMPGYDRLNLYTIAKTINYGVLDISPCPIFSSTFADFAGSINDYVREYYQV